MSIEIRYDLSGFVYTNRTRLLFAPLRILTRDGTEARPGEPIGFISARTWKEPNRNDVDTAGLQLTKAFPHNDIYTVTDDGPVLVARKIRST